jgi:hypothetical protein
MDKNSKKLLYVRIKETEIFLFLVQNIYTRAWPSFSDRNTFMLLLILHLLVWGTMSSTGVQLLSSPLSFAVLFSFRPFFIFTHRNFLVLHYFYLAATRELFIVANKIKNILRILFNKK